MSENELITETVTIYDEPERFYSYLCIEDGTFVAIDDSGHLVSSCVGNDEILWEQQIQTDSFRHVLSRKVVNVVDRHEDSFSLRLQGEPIDENDQDERFTHQRGPASLPSEYMNHFKQHGWVCLPSILPPHVVDGLEEVSCTGKYQDRKFEYHTNPIASNKAVGQAAAEPVTLWLTRQYMRTNAIRFGHSPSLAVLGSDDGERDVQGWHSDFPYLWGISRTTPDERIPVHESHGLVMGIQRNIRISPFTKESGATAFKLG